MKSKILIAVAALAVFAVFALEFVAIKSTDGQHTKCALTPMGTTPGTYAKSCDTVRP